MNIRMYAWSWECQLLSSCHDGWRMRKRIKFMIILRTLWNGVKCISEISLQWDNMNIVIIDTIETYTLFLQFHVNYNNVNVTGVS